MHHKQRMQKRNIVKYEKTLTLTHTYSFSLSLSLAYLITDKPVRYFPLLFHLNRCNPKDLEFRIWFHTSADRYQDKRAIWRRESRQAQHSSVSMLIDSTKQVISCIECWLPEHKLYYYMKVSQPVQSVTQLRCWTQKKWKCILLHHYQVLMIK